MENTFIVLTAFYRQNSRGKHFYTAYGILQTKFMWKTSLYCWGYFKDKIHAENTTSAVKIGLLSVRIMKLHDSLITNSAPSDKRTICVKLISVYINGALTTWQLCDPGKKNFNIAVFVSALSSTGNKCNPSQPYCLQREALTIQESSELEGKKGWVRRRKGEGGGGVRKLSAYDEEGRITLRICCLRFGIRSSCILFIYMCMHFQRLIDFF